MKPLRSFSLFCTAQERRIRETLDRYGKQVRPLDTRDSKFRESHTGPQQYGGSRFTTPIPPKKPQP